MAVRRQAMKLDIFNHIFPKRFYDRMLAVLPDGRTASMRS